MREIAQKLSRCSSFGALMDDAFARCPEREAIVYEDWRLTYGDLERYIHQTAHYLRHLGVRKGSRVAILSRNCPEWIIAEFALYQLGAIVVKINWRLTPPEQARMLARNQVSVAFLKAEKPEWGAELERLCADSVRLIRLEPVDGRSALCALVSGEPDTSPDVPVSRDDVACRLHTSGTTGEPKCVVYTHGGMLREIVSMLQVYPYPDGQRYQFIAQLFHSAAIGAHLSLATGGTMVLKDHFALEDYMHTLVSERIESISVVPTVLKWILDETDNGDYDLSHLKTVNYSTCPIPKALLQRAIEKLHCSFYQSYGMTEMASTVTALLPEDHLILGGRYLTSVGRALPGAAVRIVRPDGSLCDAGEEGEICVRGQGMMLGYYQMPEKTADVIRDGWYFTHDVGYLDEDGYLYLRGRKDSLIISGGENIYPEEVIDVLLKMPEIAEAAVYGMPDPKWGEHVKASIVCKPGRSLTVEQVQTFCRANMPSFRMPREVEFLPELPKNATGKVLIQALKKPTEHAKITAHWRVPVCPADGDAFCRSDHGDAKKQGRCCGPAFDREMRFYSPSPNSFSMASLSAPSALCCA